MREKKLNTMLGLEGWLSGLRNGDYAGLASQLTSLKRMSYPLLNGPYCLPHLLPTPQNFHHSEEDRMLRILRHHFNWKLDTNRILPEAFHAIVVTDLSQEIVWASEGFREMTGYSPQFATGRKPNFLQGPETSEVTKSLIREHILQEQAVVATILNYKQNGEPYQCRVDIQPIRNFSGKVTHFLAFETEIL